MRAAILRDEVLGDPARTPIQSQNTEIAPRAMPVGEGRQGNVSSSQGELAPLLAPQGDTASGTLAILRDFDDDRIPADEAQVRRARVRGMVIAEMLPARPLRGINDPIRTLEDAQREIEEQRATEARR